MQTENESEQIMTLQEASAYLRIHPNTLRKMIKNGKIKAARLSGSVQGKYRIKLKDINDCFLNRGDYL